MPQLVEISHLDTMSVVHTVSATLRKIDPRLMDHGERVAHIACALCGFGSLPLDRKTLFLLSVFHDVGAYKTEEIDRMVEFETHNVAAHSIYGYLFLKYMSPLQEQAQAILYHHAPWRELQKSDCPYKDYAALIQVADRLDIALSQPDSAPSLHALRADPAGQFCPEYRELFFSCQQAQREGLVKALKSGEYLADNLQLCKEFHLSPQESLEYLKMIIFSIDFRSEHTVTHSINTISLSLALGRHFGLDKNQLEKIYLGSMLHDVGKVAIPTEILEYPGRLDPQQMEIMRTHVRETELLIRGLVPDDICEIAVRHHEKLDGSGYPHGLCARELTFSQRIVAVADIISALSSSRSYKDSFPKEKTLNILNQMSVSQLDPDICAYVCESYDALLASTEPARQKVLSIYQSLRSDFDRLQTIAASLC